MEANAFLRRMLLVIAIIVLPLANVAFAHGGHGTGGSSGGGSGSSSGSGGSSGSTGGGHSGSGTSAGHSTTASKNTHSAPDPISLSQSAVGRQTFNQIRVYRIFQQPASTGEYRETTSDDWKRRHPHLLFGFIRY
jgi:hypothetical protein